ncbi:MAG: hypothetical protein CSA97_05375 [Bacteroidetes bacterium]|nr:MAG: hypothetical protein CSA97_05375 [Bacteroidota bacterium]
MLDRLKCNVGLKRLRDMGLPKRSLQPLIPLDSAQSLGFLIDAGNREDFEFLATYCQQLELAGVDCRVCTFFDGKETPDYLVGRARTSLIVKKDVNWLYKPVKGDALPFEELAFDYLIDFTLIDVLPLAWVKANSAAKLHIGFNEASVLGGDVVFPMQAGSPPKQMLEVLAKYLTPQE